MTHFTLVHGAWHGAWCWDALGQGLRARGHSVSAVCLSGLGERAAELSPGIELQTWVDDVAAHLTREDIRQTVLVGHSFGGNIITGVAADGAALPRIAGLIYLDAMIPESGVAPSESVSPEVWAGRREMCTEVNGTRCFRVPPASFFAIKDPDQIAYVQARLTPHPLRTYETAIRFDGLPGVGLPCHYIMVTNPVYEALAAHRQRARDLGWPIEEIDCGHDAMVERPEELAEMLEKSPAAQNAIA